MRKVSWRFCFVVTLIAFAGEFLFGPVRPADDAPVLLDLILQGLKPAWLGIIVAMSIAIGFVVTASYAVSESWNRIGRKLFPGVGEMTWGEAYVVMLLLSFFI